jgi:hypothetical protein
MSSAAPSQTYYPLGLPPGSVRAILTLMIAGLFWMLTLVPQPEGAPPVHIPLFLFALLPMVLLFFAAHGKSIRPDGSKVRSPLFLPRGIIRLLLVAGFGAAIGYQYHTDRALLESRLTPNPDDLWKWPPILLTLGLGFLAGHLMGMGPWHKSPKYQNLVAWVSLIAMLCLLAEIVLELVIRPGITQDFDPFLYECILTGLVAFYFGARS